MYTKHALSQLIEQAKSFGLPDQDVKNSNEMLKYHEYELCVDLLLTQLYEYDIMISQQFYDLFLKISYKIKIDPEKYNFIKEIIGR